AALPQPFLLLGAAWRVQFGRRDGLGGQAPTVQDLAVAAVLDEVVDGRLRRRSKAVVLLGGERDLSLQRPAAVERAHFLGLAILGRLVGGGGVGPERQVRASGLEGELGGGVVVVVLKLNRLQSVLFVLLVPPHQDGFLVGAGADDHALASDVLGLLDL